MKGRQFSGSFTLVSFAFYLLRLDCKNFLLLQFSTFLLVQLERLSSHVYLNQTVVIWRKIKQIKP